MSSLFSMGRDPADKLPDGITTDGIMLYLASDKPVYGKYDTIIFAFALLNTREEKVESRKIFSAYVEPSSVVALIAIDEKGNRYSGYVGNRTDPGDDFDHYAIEIHPKKVLSFSFYHRDLRKPLYENDRSLTQISDRIGTYTIHARVRKDFLSTQHSLLSNTFTIQVIK